MPLNFELEYVDEKGEKQRPIMIHRVCFGSIERFIGILTEHYAGKFPVWLAPTQVKVLPVSEKSMDYAKEVYEAIRSTGIRTPKRWRPETSPSGIGTPGKAPPWAWTSSSPRSRRRQRNAFKDRLTRPCREFPCGGCILPPNPCRSLYFCVILEKRAGRGFP